MRNCFIILSHVSFSLATSIHLPFLRNDTKCTRERSFIVDSETQYARRDRSKPIIFFLLRSYFATETFTRRKYLIEHDEKRERERERQGNGKISLAYACEILSSVVK